MKHIKLDFLIQDQLQNEFIPLYQVDKDKGFLYAVADGDKVKVVFENIKTGRFVLPLISLDEPFYTAYKRRKVPARINEAIDTLVEALYSYQEVKRIKASDYLDAHAKAVSLLPENNVGHIFVKDTAKTIVNTTSGAAYDFERRISSVPFLPDNKLIFVPDAEFFGVLVLASDDMSFGMAIFNPENAVIADIS